MKITNYLSFTIAAMAMAAGSNAFAGVPGEGYYSASPTTFQLTATSQVESTVVYSEDSATYTDRTSKQRIGNAEILKMLKNEGVIESVSGWSIVFVSSVEEIEGFYIKKDGKAPRNINEYVFFLTEGEGDGFDVGYTTGSGTESPDGYTESKTINFLSQIGIFLGNDGEESETAMVFGAAKLNYTFTYSYYIGDPEGPAPAPGPSPFNYVINYFSMPVATGILGDYFYSGYGDLISGRVSGTQGSPIEIYEFR